MLISSKWIDEYLYPTIKNSQFNETKIVEFEDVTDLLIPFVTYKSIFHKDTLRKMDVMGIHWYWDFLFPKSLSLGITHLLLPDKPIMMSESSPSN